MQPSLPSLLLCCHTDVVPANQSLWTQPAFEGTLVDGKIYGRGAQDMKSVGVQVNQKSASSCVGQAPNWVLKQFSVSMNACS